MWNPGQPAAEQCEGCTWVTTQVAELSYLHSRDITYAVFCQGPYDESARYRDFMGWDMPWYSAHASLDRLLVGRHIGFVPSGVLRPGRRQRLRNVLDDRTGRRGNGQQLRAHGPDRVRTPGDLGRLPTRLAPTVARDQLRDPDKRTPHRPVGAGRSWTLRRPRRAAVNVTHEKMGSPCSRRQSRHAVENHSVRVPAS
jgi:hypothetical protein